jgi:predicted RecB family nuclease
MTYKQNTITGSVIYSHFRHLCPYHTWLLFNVGLTDVIPAPSDRLLMDTGIQHEDEALKYFQEQLGDECVEIPANEGRNREEDMVIRAEKTISSMKEGKQVIYHGILAPDMSLLEKVTGPLLSSIPMRGETDFLFRVDNDQNSQWCPFHYEVGDAKSSRSSKFCQQMQVTFYTWLLGHIQGVSPQCGRILTRPLNVEKMSVPFREELFLIDDYIWTLRTFLEEEFNEILQRNEDEFFFHPKGACGTCPFYDRCIEKAVAANDLSLLPDIRKIQKRHLNRVGVMEIESLADANDDILKKAAKATGVTFNGFNKLKLQAMSLMTEEPVSRRLFASPKSACLAITQGELDLPGQKEGVMALDFTNPALAHVYFDMESNPYFSVEYLFGMMVDETGKNGRRTKGPPEFHTAHTLSRAEEYRAFRSFLERMDELRDQFGEEGFIVFHYAHYEPTHLLGLADKYKDRSSDLIDRVDYLNQRMVDLYKLVRNTYFLPVRSYSIKEVAPCIKTLMEKKGLTGGHQWKKIHSFEELENALKNSNWPKAEIKDSLDDIKAVMKDFELKDPAMMFDPSADMSVVWYNLYVVRKKRVWMKLIEIYNEDDLNATRALVDWFLFMEGQTEGSKTDA